MENKTHNKRKTILIGLGVLGTGVAGFLGWNYWKNKKKTNQEEDTSSITETANTTTAASRNDDFPLKRGSKGNRVTLLQNALVKKYGAGILPKYGVDGMFGKEVEAALVHAKIPTTINEANYTKIVGGGLSGLIKYGEEVISIEECEIFKVEGKLKMKIPKHIILGVKEFTHQGWIYFIPKNSTELFRVRKEQVKSVKQFKNEKSKKHKIYRGSLHSHSSNNNCGVNQTLLERATRMGRYSRLPLSNPTTREYPSAIR